VLVSRRYYFFDEFVLSECLWIGSLKLMRIHVPFCPCVKIGVMRIKIVLGVFSEQI